MMTCVIPSAGTSVGVPSVGLEPKGTGFPFSPDSRTGIASNGSLSSGWLSKTSESVLGVGNLNTISPSGVSSEVISPSYLVGSSSASSSGVVS